MGGELYYSGQPRSQIVSRVATENLVRDDGVRWLC
jgi:hypothetical protein